MNHSTLAFACLMQADWFTLHKATSLCLMGIRPEGGTNKGQKMTTLASRYHDSLSKFGPLKLGQWVGHWWQG
jgi:hypothetical protein